MNPYLVLVAAYLVGAIPFGWMVARMKGVDLFRAGSGNIGATNVGRVLGKFWGILVFTFDFLKGALPVVVCRLLPMEVRTEFGSPSWLDVLTALAAFLGHLYPIYLGFRGGKGVATGAGTVAMLMPGPAALAILIWLTVVASSQIVSLGSVAAVLGLSAARLLGPSPFADDQLPGTTFALAGTLLVIFKHLGNLNRIRKGTESRWPNSSLWQTMSKSIHLLALGLWFGSAVFFNFIAAPTMNQSFKQAIATAPNDRTAHLDITHNLDEDQKVALGSALFGTAVGPLFPKFFAIESICVVLAFITALRWWNAGGKAHRIRVVLLFFGVFLIAAGWPISQHVSELRLQRFSLDLDVASRAKSEFVTWHFVSLFLSGITALVAIVSMILAAWLPGSTESK